MATAFQLDPALASSTKTAGQTQIALRSHEDLKQRAACWLADLPLGEHPARHPGWLDVLRRGLRHEVMCLEAMRDGRTVGLLPLALVKSLLFGRFLVSLPYLNSAGAVGVDAEATRVLIDRAVLLADELDVRYFEMRNETACEHAALTARLSTKVCMRLALPPTVDELSAQLKSKLRSQIRAGQRHGFEVTWGGLSCLDDFYRVFSRNMRDLGTPVYGRGLFEAILTEFPSQAELCVVRLEGEPAAAALLVHGRGITEVPSASSLREFNSRSANMAMYWHLLCRAVERGQKTFDFGRSTEGGNTYRFKKQWGAEPFPSVWQYYVRRGSSGELRPENGRYGLAIRIWKRLPLWLANTLGPRIVRGIP